MSMRRVKGWLLLSGLFAIVGAGLLVLTAPQTEARPCCWVMVCSASGCHEECRTCPKFP
ncbi:MAG TPA: hypothetical protein VJS92_03810 [Candidatus Polarisedimenticolaceae bacterium]|nr:hypothetical protein [Candidatus Polarisedimenticolaceae bacterium]